MAVWFRRARNWVTEKLLIDWRYKLAALGSAFVLWAYLAGQMSMQTMVSARVYYQRSPAGMVMVDQTVQQVQITLSARRDRLLGLKDRPLWVVIDLSDLRVGRNLYRITKQDVMGANGIEIKSIAPHQVVITLVPEKMP